MFQIPGKSYVVLSCEYLVKWVNVHEVVVLIQNWIQFYLNATLILNKSLINKYLFLCYSYQLEEKGLLNGPISRNYLRHVLRVWSSNH